MHLAVEWRIQCEKCINLVNKSTNCQMNSPCFSPHPLSLIRALACIMNRWIFQISRSITRSDNNTNCKSLKFHRSPKSQNFHAVQNVLAKLRVTDRSKEKNPRLSKVRSRILIIVRQRRAPPCPNKSAAPEVINFARIPGIVLHMHAYFLKYSRCYGTRA